jgi:glycosyltransferase involved in cell wall biosynthesis
MARTDKIFVQHGGQLAALPRQWRGKASVLPKVCNLSSGLGEAIEIRPHAQREKYVAWVAMLRQPKRPDVLVEMARAAPNISFVVCGGITHHRCPPGYGEQIIEAFRSLPNIDYRGRVSPQEAAQVIADAAVLLSTSDEEGFPNTFMQAWSSGTPVVSVKLDPDCIIERFRLGAVSGCPEKAILDLTALTHSAEERERIADRARRYIIDAHSEAAVVAAFERGINGFA